MKLLDLLSLIIENLSRRKARVGLTAVGVIIGTAAVVLLVSLGAGLQASAEAQLGGIGDLTKITVYPGFDESVMAGNVVVEIGPGSPPPGQVLITEQTIADISAIPGVTAVIPQDYLQGQAILSAGRLEGYSSILGIGTSDLSTLGVRPQGGTLELGRGQAIAGFMVPQNFFDPRGGRPGQEPPPPPELLDQRLTLTLVKYSQDGTEIRKRVPVQVVGLLAEARDEPDWSVYIPMADLEGYNTWFTGQRIDRSKMGYNQLIVKVEDVDQVLDVTEQITNMGLQAYTPQSFVQGITGFYTILQVVLGGVGAIALLVAAIGIANTMAMAILERTREIGLMKAVGATNRHVLTVFLGEAAGIGFLGGLGGVAIGWGLSQVLNVLALAYFAGQAVETGAPPPSTAVATPLWLPIFALVFATIMGLISGLYPALRAATLIPVNALKYE